MKANKKQARITENIFALMLNTQFSDIARKELDKDLSSTDVWCDKYKGEIIIYSDKTDKPLYKVTVEKV